MLHFPPSIVTCFEGKDVKLKINLEVKAENEEKGERKKQNAEVSGSDRKNKQPGNETLAVARKQEDKEVTLQLLFYRILLTQSVEMKNKMINS